MPDPHPRADRASHVHPPSFGADIGAALAELHTPTFILDRSGLIRWMNRSAIEWLGDQQGRLYVEIFAPEAQPIARQEFTKKILGRARASALRSMLRRRTGADLPVDIHCVALDADGRVVGILAIVHINEDDLPPPPLGRALTPRQLEILQHLAEGKTTSEIAETLHLSTTTVRNHIAHLLASLGVHTRVQAVIAASRTGLIKLRPPGDDR